MRSQQVQLNVCQQFRDQLLILKQEQQMRLPEVHMLAGSHHGTITK